MTTLAPAQPRAAGRVRIPSVKFRIGICAGALVLGALIGYLGERGSATQMLALFAVLVPVLLWKRPYLGPAIILALALLVEQNADPIIPITDSIPMFKAIGPGHLQGSDILVLVVLVVYLAKGRAADGTRWFPRSHVSTAIVCLLGCVLLSVAVGNLHGGSLREALMEARPYVYLSLTYFLTSVLVTDRRALMGVLWAFVGTVAFKAAQGIYVYFRHRHDTPRPEDFIGHEASYFFVAYMVLVLALWLFAERGKLRLWATRLLPLIVFCNLINDRRAAWEMLGGAILAFVVIAYQTAPIRRRMLGNAIIASLLIAAVYFPVMWNQSGSLAQPVRAIRSQITPSTRDASSDLYRVQENANLQYNIKQDGLIGEGFGRKIDYALPITNISSIDPLIAYVPHNGVLYQMMRMGLLGSIAVWFLIAAGIITGCRLARAKDSLVAVVGMFLACSLVAYALMGAVDQGFFWYRIAFLTGAMLGLAEAARRIQRTQTLGGPTRSHLRYPNVTKLPGQVKLRIKVPRAQ